MVSASTLNTPGPNNNLNQLLEYRQSSIHSAASLRFLFSPKTTDVKVVVFRGVRALRDKFKPRFASQQ
jgi:hypothetical protein